MIMFEANHPLTAQATIRCCDLQRAMKQLGLNLADQELVDIPNKIARDGL